jgi:cytochrome c peroxidase
VRCALLLGLAAALALGTGAVATETFDWHLPPSISPPALPAGSEMTTARIALGRRLFYDADLSRDGTISCGTCHEQHRAFTEGNATHGGVDGSRGRRNVMGLANVAWFSPLTWADPAQHDLESQVHVPLMGDHPVEMGMAGQEQEQELAHRLSTDDCYRKMFAAAFADGRIDAGNVTHALAAFERTLISYDAPYDHFRRGDSGAITAEARDGARLFASLGCAGCHAGRNFTDLKFHNIGLYDVDGKGGYPASDRGLRESSGRPEDEGAFRTPSLRNVALTAPYMHDGSVKDLAAAIDAHVAGSNPLRDPALARVAITPSQRTALLAFLPALTDQTFVNNPDLALPKTACGKPNF